MIQIFNDNMGKVRQVKIRKIFLQLVSLVIAVGSTLSIWKILQIVTFSESPIIVVLTDSMIPALKRGDLLFLSHLNKPFEVGEMIVYHVKDYEVPILHRVLQVQQNGFDPLDQLVLTKGDNNLIDDRGLYPRKQMWLQREDIMGKIEGVLPYVGYITIILYENPDLKYFIIGLVSLYLITANSPYS